MISLDVEQGKSHLVCSAGTLEKLQDEGLQQKLQTRATRGLMGSQVMKKIGWCMVWMKTMD